MRSRLKAIIMFSMLLVASMPTVAEKEMTDDAYILKSGDVLYISVWKEQDLQQEVIIAPDGRLSFPLVGHLQTKGMTIKGVEDEIVKRLSSYIPDVVVNVAMRSTSQSAYVIGKVARPGGHALITYINVMQALSLSGGPTAFAAVDKIKILRTENGKQIAIPFKYSDVESGIKLEQNISLQNGDVVVVP